VTVNGALVEAKMSTFTLESTHFIFNKCPIYTLDGASAKFSTYSHETDYSVLCGISCELEGYVHRPIVDSESTIAG
jgi:hypothetical protein